MHQALTHILANAPSRTVEFATREEWLTEFTAAIRPAFADIGNPLPEKVRISCGFPRGCSAAIGQCWSAKASEDGAREIFVSPSLSKPSRVCDVVLHELVHAALPDDAKHGAEFKQLALAMGLTGKMTATEASEELQSALDQFIPAYLGKYPHSPLNPAATLKKQSTRMIKLLCDGCGMVIRTTRKWLDEAGAPVCACGKEFSEE